MLEWSVLQGREPEPPSAGHAAVGASSRGGASAHGPAADWALEAPEAGPAGPSTGRVWGLCQAVPGGAGRKPVQKLEGEGEDRNVHGDGPELRAGV